MARFWHAEEIEKLIELVSVRPCIWNADDTDFTDPHSRNEAFKAIGNQMGLQTEVVRSKFRNLRAQYFRIYRNPVQRNNPKKWIHYEALRFLNEDSSQLQASNTISITNQDESSNDEDLIEEEVLDEYSNEEFIAEDFQTLLPQKGSEANAHKTSSLAKDLDPKVSIDRLNRCKPRTLVMKATAKEKDTHTIFGEHVANELRSLKHNKRLQQTLKCAILKAIYEINEALVS